MPSESDRNTGQRGTVIPKLIILLISIPVFITLSELILTLIPVDTFFENRFFVLNRALDYPEIFKKDEHLFWRLRPSQTIASRFFEGNEYKINSDGLRGEEIPSASDKIRIVALGNSCTFGWRMKDEDTYLNRLEKLIDNDSTLPEVETINAAIPGYSSFQGRRFYVTDICKLNPDIVIIMFGWNDQWAAADEIPDKNQEFPPQWVLDIQDIISRLEIYRLMRKLILSATEESLDDIFNKEKPVYRVGIEDFYNNLNVIVSQAKEEGVETILLTSPIPSLEKYYPPGIKSNMHSFHNFYNLQTRNLAYNTKSILIDAAREFDKYDSLFDDAAKDPIHFNARGHRVIAEAIYGYFKKNEGSLSKRTSSPPPDRLSRKLGLDKR